MPTRAKKAILGEDGRPTGLVFTSDAMPGYSRKRRGKGFAFYHPDGSGLSDRAERKRILSLAIPPAYEGVWICTKANGHLQATGFDARKRKQYRYHPAWHDHSANRKFGDLPAFAVALPRMRDACRRALSLQDPDRDRVIAGIVFLLDTTGYRIGSARYEKENRSHGLSSLLTRHIRELGESSVRLKFRGKGGHEHEAEIENAGFAKLMAELHELPGQHIFRYADAEGGWHDIGSADVNGWIKQISGGDFSAKQFRTWKATVLCARELGKQPPCETAAECKRAVTAAIRETAAKLNHTLSTCRKYYIHPAIFASYGTGELYEVMNSPAPPVRKSDGAARLHADERRVLKLITRMRAGNAP